MKRALCMGAGALGLAGLLTACAVAPVRYYSLAAPAELQPATPSSDRNGHITQIFFPSLCGDDDLFQGAGLGCACLRVGCLSLNIDSVDAGGQQYSGKFCERIHGR